MSESCVCFSSTAELNTRLRFTEAAPKPVRDALKAPSEDVWVQRLFLIHSWAQHEAQIHPTAPKPVRDALKAPSEDVWVLRLFLIHSRAQHEAQTRRSSP